MQPTHLAPAPNWTSAREQLEEAFLSASVGEVAGPIVPRRRFWRMPWRRVGRSLEPFGVFAQTPYAALVQAIRNPREFAHVFGFALRQSLIRPLVFYIVDRAAALLHGALRVCHGRR